MLIKIVSQHTMENSLHHWTLTGKQKSAVHYINYQSEIVFTEQCLMKSQSMLTLKALSKSGCAQKYKSSDSVLIFCWIINNIHLFLIQEYKFLHQIPIHSQD